MTNDVEELLREGIDRLTAGASVPAGLAGRARLRNRQRRIAIRAAAAAGTAVVAAVAVIAVTGGPEPSSHAVHELTVAYVTSRTQHALTAAQQGKLIEEVRSVGHHGDFGFTVLNTALGAQRNPAGSAIVPGVLRDVHAQRTAIWLYRGLFLQEGFSAAGRPVFSSSISTVTSAAGNRVLEDYGAAYPARIRWRTPIGGPNGPALKRTCANALPGPLTPDLGATIAKDLSCKLLVLDGHQQVNGIDAIKLSLKLPPYVRIRETLWVDPSTYLLLRTSASFPAGHGQVSVLTADYQWLPPTGANLAALHAAIRRAAIPAGFRKLPRAELPLAGFDPSGTANP